MEEKLDELAAELEGCRRNGNRLTLQCVMESARILIEARTLSQGGFLEWLREKAHMTYDTACRHIRVYEFVSAHPELTAKLATLSIAKIYALSTLDFGAADGLLNGPDSFSQPLEQLSDVRFYEEFRDRFPREKKRRNRQHAYQALYSAMVRVENALRQGKRFASRLTAAQIEKLTEKLRSLIRDAAEWKIVA